MEGKNIDSLIFAIILLIGFVFVCYAEIKYFPYSKRPVITTNLPNGTYKALYNDSKFLIEIKNKTDSDNGQKVVTISQYGKDPITDIFNTKPYKTSVGTVTPNDMIVDKNISAIYHSYPLTFSFEDDDMCMFNHKKIIPYIGKEDETYDIHCFFNSFPYNWEWRKVKEEK